MSSDRAGSVGDATEPAGAAGNADGGSDQGVADDAQADDPWFAPGPKTTPHDTAWFLRTGRAGLHPDSETAWDDASAEMPADHHEMRVTAAGAPPWAGETTAVSASAPPPWETGPWPGPGSLRSGGSLTASDPAGSHASRRAASLAGRAALDGTTLNGAELDGSALDGTAQDSAGLGRPGAGTGLVRWPPRTVVAAGLIPLVVPGLVIGLLSLRQATSEAVRKASWLAIGASVAWAVIIIVIVTSVGGGSAGGCGRYPASVQRAYEKALSDLSSNAPASVQAADFQQAASLANASAAATGQIGVRTALFSMANDMSAARGYVVAGRPISATLRQHLADDGKAPSGSCAS